MQFSIGADASVNSTTGYVAPEGSGAADVTIGGTAASWQVTDSLYVGGSDSAAGGFGTITLDYGGTLDVGNTLKTWSNGKVNLKGGTLIAHRIDAAPGTLVFESGELRYSQATEFTSSSTLAEQGIITVDGPKTITVNGVATLGTPMVIDGGVFAADSIVGREFIDFRTGSIASTTDMTVGDASQHTGSVVTLSTNQNLQAGGTLTIAAEGLVTLAGGTRKLSPLKSTVRCNSPAAVPDWLPDRSPTVAWSKVLDASRVISPTHRPEK